MTNKIRKKRLHAAFIGACIFFVTLLTGGLIYQMTRISILPISYAVAIILAIIVIFGIGIFLQLRKRIYMKIAGLVLTFLVIAADIEGIYLYENSIKALSTIANQATETTTYGIYVLETSDINSVDELFGKTVGISDDMPDDELSDNELAEQLTKYDFNLKSYDSQLSLVKGLTSKECDGAILNSSYVSILEDPESGENLEVGLRLLEEVDVSKVVEKPNVVTPEDPFIVYISGKDTWGHISVVSRSDVNILAVVNPGTKHILLVSTPRDYYVPLSISNGIKDKLTHAGIYGTDVSEDTMEMLYGIAIDHYFKVNFSGFEGLINAMGGITVWSDYAFDVENIGHFSKGENHLNGLAALAFVRERHSFARGDVQRGENQMNVIQSVVQKMTSKSTLINYGDIMKECDGTFATDFSTEEIADLVAYQLSNPGEWNIEKMSVSGRGEHNHVYSLSKTCYVMVPNEEDIAYARERIEEIMNER
ncbi:LCP family protein [Pseudobutyrivibrio ruminis]|uniref:LCP family protein n=1 Tax=Pseudobutyrivibrio ruminis TaxID=46206 RepID=UPI00040CC783|nr:LCP family protein [Pseudobutyrivibrio ruminis]